MKFEQQLEQYANLAVKVGLNLRAGQRLLINAPLQTAPLVRLIVANAYQAGVRLVDVIWEDEQLEPIRFRHAPRDSFEEFPVWQSDLALDYAKNGDAMLSIYAQPADRRGVHHAALGTNERGCYSYQAA